MRIRCITFLCIPNIAYHHTIAQCTMPYCLCYDRACGIVAFRCQALHVLVHALTKYVPCTVWQATQGA